MKTEAANETGSNGVSPTDSCLADGPGFGLGVRWTEEMRSRSKITKMDGLSTGYIPVYMNLRIKPVWFAWVTPRQALWKETMKTYK